jgi:hypothetical protein
MEGDKMKKITLLLLALILSACTLGGTELSRNESKWQDANVTHYRFQLSVGCFCAFRSQMPMTVEVKDGQVVSMVDVNGQELSASDPTFEFIAKYATIEGLFAELSTDEVKKADSVSITYDPTYGFPADVAIDFQQIMADEELYLTLSAFESLP